MTFSNIVHTQLRNDLDIRQYRDRNANKVGIKTLHSGEKRLGTCRTARGSSQGHGGFLCIQVVHAISLNPPLHLMSALCSLIIPSPVMKTLLYILCRIDDYAFVFLLVVVALGRRPGALRNCTNWNKSASDIQILTQFLGLSRRAVEVSLLG